MNNNICIIVMTLCVTHSYGPGNHERMRQQWQEQQTRQQWNKDEHEFFIKHLMRFLVCAFLANSLLVYLNYK